LSQARPYWRHIGVIFLLSLAGTPLTLLAPLPLKIAVDNVISSRPLPGVLSSLLPGAARSEFGLLAFAVGLLVLTELLTNLQGFCSWWLQTYTGEKLTLSFRARLFSHVQRLSLSYHDTNGTADSTYRIQYDAAAIQNILIGGVLPLITALFMLVGMIYVTARINWRLALVALAVSPVLYLLMWLYRDRLRDQSRDVKKLESSALSVVQEALAAVRVVKSFGKEAREQERFVHHSSEGLQARLRLLSAQGQFSLLISLTIAAGSAAVLFIGVRHVRAGSMTLGELLMAMAYLSQLYEPLKTLSKKVADLQGSLASAERVFSLLDEAPDVVERPGSRPLLRAAGALAFRNVSFDYNKNRRVLRDMSFDVPAGTRLGIAGRTGAGKTTLVSLLTRFYDPVAGAILLDGVDLRDYKLADLRNQFAIVLQEPLLFSTSIAENIAYARPDASEAEIIEAAKLANAHDFIIRLPEGYQTEVGERGQQLSGGERQRISLARAFLKDAPILILDEPTSSVDVRTEAAIIEALERLMRDRTTFVISHRLTLLQNCDLRILVEDGRLVAGTPTAHAGGMLAVEHVTA
jgi:ATP-binding cassette subfamily B protein